MTAFSDDIEVLIKDLSEWIRESEIRPKDIRYADIFNADGGKRPKHIATFLLNDEGGLDIMGTPGSRLNPYKRGFLTNIMFRNFVRKYALIKR